MLSIPKILVCLMMALSIIIYGALYANASSNLARKIDEEISQNPALGDVIKQYELAASYYEQGDLVKSCAWVEKAAEQGNVDAQFRTGFCYHSGSGGMKTLYKAAYWYEKAAEQGHHDAMNNLAIMLETGEGIEKDCRKAEQLYLQSADFNVHSLQGLGNLYWNGCDNVPPNLPEALRYTSRAAMQGFGPSQLSLGHMFANSNDRMKNNEEACYWAIIASSHDPSYWSSLGHPEYHSASMENVDIYCGLLSAPQAANARQRASQFRPTVSAEQSASPTTPQQPPDQPASNSSKSASGHRWKKATN